MSRRMCWDRRDDRGVTLVLFALFITALFVITALVVDLSFVRQTRQADKSASDFAVAAGIRGMDDGSGQIDTWGGICTAVDYLKANRPEFTSLVAVDAADNPISPDPCAAPPTEYCVTSPTDWRSYIGIADGGDVRVTIQNGYDLSASGFSEDADEYAGDEGVDACEQLAVIIEQRQDPFFGGVAGSSGWETTMRSVSRLEVGTSGLATAALVLLERTGCGVLQIGGSNASVTVSGVGDTPGIIHSDSLGTETSGTYRCRDTQNIFDVDGSGSVQIRAGRAQTPVGSEEPGIISARALSDPAGNPAFVASPSPEQVCAQILATDCTGTTGGGVTPNELVGRGIADVRYRTRLIALRDEAAARFAWTQAQAQAAGFATPACGAPAYTAERVWLNCSVSDSTHFTSSVKEVVITGNVSISGSRVFRFDGAVAPLEADAPTKVYIGGSVSHTGDAIRINDNSAATCAARHAAAPMAKNVVVIGGSGISHTGSGVFRMCQTSVLMTQNNGTCAIPTFNGREPYSNSCSGSVSSAGGSERDWSAPNVNSVTAPTATQLQNLEDLAFWTETASGNSMTGNGNLTLAGIFVSPNANAFVIGGNGDKFTEDAQFLTRRLEVAGQGHLTMSPQPQNALQIPVLGGYTLVR